MPNAVVKFQSDTSGFQKGIDQINDSLKGVKSAAAGIGAAFAAIGAVKITTEIIGGLKNTVIGASKAAAAYETMAVQLEVIIGNASKASQLLRDLTEYGAQTPLQRNDLADASKTLLAFGIRVEDLLPILKRLGDISGGDAERLKTLANVFGKVSAATKMSMEDVNQFIDAGFNPLENIVRKTGKTMLEVRDSVSKGEIGIKDLQESMKQATSEGGRFHNMLERVADTTEGKLSNLADTWESLKIAFGLGFNTGLDVVLDTLNDSLPRLTDAAIALGNSAGQLVASLEPYIKEFIDKLSTAVKNGGVFELVVDQLVAVLTNDRVKAAVKELFSSATSTAMDIIPGGGYTVAGAGAGALGLILLKLANSVSKLATETANTASKIKGAYDKAGNLLFGTHEERLDKALDKKDAARAAMKGAAEAEAAALGVPKETRLEGGKVRSLYDRLIKNIIDRMILIKTQETLWGKFLGKLKGGPKSGLIATTSEGIKGFRFNPYVLLATFMSENVLVPMITDMLEPGTSATNSPLARRFAQSPPQPYVMSIERQMELNNKEWEENRKKQAESFSKGFRDTFKDFSLGDTLSKEFELAIRKAKFSDIITASKKVAADAVARANRPFVGPLDTRAQDELNAHNAKKEEDAKKEAEDKRKDAAKMRFDSLIGTSRMVSHFQKIGGAGTLGHHPMLSEGKKTNNILTKHTTLLTKIAGNGGGTAKFA